MANYDNITLESLPARLSNQVLVMRKTFKTYADLTGKWLESKEDLAPKFMELYHSLVHQLGVGFRFNHYVHLLDPSCPLHRDTVGDVPGYRDHKSYNAGMYLKRLVDRAPRGAGKEKGAELSNKNPMVRLARVLKVIMSQIKNEAVVWHAIQTEYQLSAGAMTTLRNMVASTSVPPLLALTGIAKTPRITASVITFAPAATPRKPLTREGMEATLRAPAPEETRVATRM